jgi:hypothetical protein
MAEGTPRLDKGGSHRRDLQVRSLRHLWGVAGHVGGQSYAGRCWHQAQVGFGGDRIGDPAESGDGGVGDREYGR